jgi:hypothetical protein
MPRRPPPSQRLELLFPLTTAQERVSQQITRGQALLAARIDSKSQLSDAQDQKIVGQISMWS